MKKVTAPLRGILITVVALFAFGVGISSANAASTYFLQIDGVRGSSTDRGHKDWIDVSSFYWGITNSSTVGGVGGGSRGGPVGSPLSWTQQLDSSVPALFVGVGSGKRYPRATLDVQSAGTNPVVFFQMVFEDIALTALSLTGATDVGAAGALVYGRLTMTYRPLQDDGRLGGPVVGGWDFSGNQPAAFFGSPEVLEGLILAGPTAVPAPAAVWLLGTGLLGLFGAAWRKRHG
jgi:type VI secretion system secreted protein Hcp